MLRKSSSLGIARKPMAFSVTAKTALAGRLSRKGSRIAGSPSFGLSVRSKPRRIRVLVAEDQRNVRDAAVEFLTDRGMIVRKATTADQLFDNLKRFKPDVVVLDHHFERCSLALPKLMPALLERFPGTRIVVMSDRPSDREVSTDNPRNWGAFDVVSKAHILQRKLLDTSVSRAAGF